MVNRERYEQHAIELKCIADDIMRGVIRRGQIVDAHVDGLTTVVWGVDKDSAWALLDLAQYYEKCAEVA